MKEKFDNYDVGVIVGRFQVPELHQEHLKLIETVCDKHNKVIIFLGLSPLMVTEENPLDFEARKQMILEEFPQITIQYIKDMSSDELWSKKLDGMIGDLITPNQKPVLYGGRDSFVHRYTGRFPTTELEPETYVRFSGTDVRRAIASKSTKASSDFRAGVVWAAMSKFPTCYPTVDIAIFNEENNRILLAKKPYENAWRFVGGFVDATDKSFEQAARREVHEETHIEITDPKYLVSMPVDDWRYRNEKDKIMTSLFMAKYQSGSPTPDDDIESLEWFDWDEITANSLVPSHQPLFRALQGHKLVPIKKP